jgi:hypothetical protein
MKTRDLQREFKKYFVDQRETFDAAGKHLKKLFQPSER